MRPTSFTTEIARTRRLRALQAENRRLREALLVIVGGSAPGAPARLVAIRALNPPKETAR